MAISSPGIGSGLDVNSIVSQLVALERKPITQLQTQQSSLQTKLSAYSRVKSELAALQDAADDLLDATTWSSRTVSTSNAQKLTASVGSSALTGKFSVQVGALAKGQITNSGGFADGAAVGTAGKLEINTGTWAGAAFSGTSSVTIDVSATDKLSDVAKKINDSGAGVTAMVVTSGGQQHLLIKGSSTGVAQGFQINAFEAVTDEFGAVTYPPVTDASTSLGKLMFNHNGTDFVGMNRSQSAQDASISIDGVVLTSPTNTVKDAVAGVTLNLLETTTSGVLPDPSTQGIEVAVGVDQNVGKTALEAFRTAYNKLNATLSDLTKADPTGSNDGALQGDSTAVSLQNMLRRMVGDVGPASASIKRLSDIGLQVQRDGSLATNSTKLNEALENVGALRDFLSASGATSQDNGIARRIRDFARAAVGTSGSVSGRSTALKAAIDRKSSDIERAETRISQVQQRLLAQYSRLDANLGTINGLGSFVSQQIAQWNK